MSTFVPLLQDVRARIRPPVVVILGSPWPVAELVAAMDVPDVTCFQLDLHHADRLREELEGFGSDATVEVRPDLWDLPARFRTAVLPVHAHGERELKLDMVDQAYHVLEPGGLLVSLSEYARDQFCPRWHKKVFGKCSSVPSRKEGSVFWSAREGDHPRRRHEVTFTDRVLGGEFVEFLSRPGVFCYGRLDNGAKALLECAEIREGDRVLDVGCGVGVVGVLAMQRAGPDGHVSFVDSNVRAIQMAEHNARAVGLSDFRAVATSKLEGLPERDFDVVLANPPYHAQAGIARLFAERSRPLLKPGGRFYLVTKLVEQVGAVVEEVFGPVTVLERRNYAVLQARAPFARNPE